MRNPFAVLYRWCKRIWAPNPFVILSRNAQTDLAIRIWTILVPIRLKYPEKNGFGPFSCRFFVPIRVGLTYGIPPEFSGGVHLFIQNPPDAIGQVPSSSGHAIAYRWRSLPRVRRHRASKPQGSSRTSAALAGHDGPINMRLSFPHPLLVCSGHVHVGTRM